MHLLTNPYFGLNIIIGRMEVLCVAERGLVWGEGRASCGSALCPHLLFSLLVGGDLCETDHQKGVKPRKEFFSFAKLAVFVVIKSPSGC